jgi:hypothetical protein
MSKPVIVIVIVLMVAIGVAYFTAPNKKAHPTMTAPRTLSQQSTLPENLGDTSNSAEQPGQPELPSPIRKAPAALAAAVSAASPLLENDFELLQERYGRDNPFAPLYDVPVKKSFSEKIATLPMMMPVPPPVSIPPEFRLSAIAIRNGQGIAIIDGEILREGDSVKNFNIISIKPDQVELRGKYGDTVYLKLRQQYHGNFDTSKSEISNIYVKKSEPVRSVNPVSNSSSPYMPGPLPPLPEYSIPGPDDFQSEPLPSSGTLP